MPKGQNHLQPLESLSSLRAGVETRCAICLSQRGCVVPFSEERDDIVSEMLKQFPVTW